MIAGRTPTVPPPAFEVDALVDRGFLAEQRDMLGGAELIRLARIFHRSSRQIIAGIEIAAARDDRIAVQELAHRLRSAAGVFGLAHLSRLAAGIEAEGASLPMTDLLAGIARLRAARCGAIGALVQTARDWPAADA